MEEKFKLNYTLRFILLCFVAVILSVVAINSCFEAEGNDFEITFIDVGQGDCAYIKTPDGYRILVDGGDEGSYEKYIKPYLARKKIKHINAVILSHFHSDHASGILEMLEDNMRVDALYAPYDYGNESLFEDKIKDICKNMNINVIETRIGDVVFDNDGVFIKAWFPSYYQYDNTKENYNENNDSLVFTVDYNGVRTLFTGDIEEDVEKAIYDNIDLDSHILKVAHHGSKTSSSETFLDVVSPQYAVISCGENNQNGFPHIDVLKRLKKYNTEVLRTDLKGDITFVVDENGSINVKTSRQEVAGYGY